MFDELAAQVRGVESSAVQARQPFVFGLMRR
jgi:hypothetical protein